MLVVGCARQPERAAAVLVPAPSRAAPPPPAAPAIAAPAPVPSELSLRAALPVLADEEFQPSGLTLHDGQLLTVSDKHETAIYALDLEGGVARARPFVQFDLPDAEPEPLDFEGVSEDGHGGWWVVSETRLRVLHVVPDAPPGSAEPRRAHASWLTPSLREAGRASGCLGVPNAGFEGVIQLGDGGLLLAIERDPRALLWLGGAGVEAASRAGAATLEALAPAVWVMQGSVYPLPEGRGVDFTDLTRVGDRVYALARNAHLVVRLEPTASGWREGPAFSYRATENDPRFWYQSRTYGLAEGLAVGADSVFVVLDNNGQARAADGAERRPLLFVFERPEAL